jgi:hypothetical protein
MPPTSVAPAKTLTRKLVVIALATAILPITFAEARAQTKADSAFKSTQLALPHQSKDKFVPEELLSNLRDMRLSVTLVKQQAVNIFMEATRTLVKVEEQPLEETPQGLNFNMYDKSQAYLEPRKDWLVYYINTMEPILHLLNEDMQDVENNGLGLPENIGAKVTPLWKLWKEDVLAINKSMDALQEQIGQNKANQGIATTALSIYEKASDMEKVRFQAAQICREELRKTAAENESKERERSNK